jgi:hypothetical protein
MIIDLSTCNSVDAGRELDHEITGPTTLRLDLWGPTLGGILGSQPLAAGPLGATVADFVDPSSLPTPHPHPATIQPSQSAAKRKSPPELMDGGLYQCGDAPTTIAAQSTA